MKSTKHIPYLCRKCMGPMTADLRCTSCGTKGRMSAFRESPAKSQPSVRCADIVFDLEARDDVVSRILQEENKNFRRTAI